MTEQTETTEQTQHNQEKLRLFRSFRLFRYPAFFLTLCHWPEGGTPNEGSKKIRFAPLSVRFLSGILPRVT